MSTESASTWGKQSIAPHSPHTRSRLLADCSLLFGLTAVQTHPGTMMFPMFGAIVS